MKSFATSWLRAEGAAVFAVCLLAYRQQGLPWLWFAVFFLTPDLSMLGYLAGVRPGALAYNLAHTYAHALVALALGLLAGAPLLLGIGLVWTAHIGFDRALGYGLKSPEGFALTHLGPIGRAKR